MNKITIHINSLKKNQYGATLVIVAVVLIVLIGVGALAVDLGFAYLQRTTLQKAVDAGALAGARELYQDNGKTISFSDASTNAKTIIQQNINGIDNENMIVNIGHWAFGINDPDDRGFHKWDIVNNPNPEPINLSLYEGNDLDGVTDHINAVQIIANVQSPSFFSRILGSDSITVRTEAVAYLGFAGTADMFEFDLPIAVCQHSILDNENGTVDCTVGRMVPDPRESAMWTDLEICDATMNIGESGAASKNTIASKIPDSCDPFVSMIDKEFFLNQGIKTNNGMIDSVYQKMHSCWEEVTNRESAWTVRLPVISCDYNTCNAVIGAIAVDIIWVHDTGGKDPHYQNIPRKMSASGFENYICDECFDNGNWTCTATSKDASTREDCWNEFVLNFNLKDLDGNVPDYEKKQIFFSPNCEESIPLGGTGGQNFGILAKIPILVK